MPSLHLRPLRRVHVHTVEVALATHPVARLAAGDRSWSSNFSSMSYWAVTTDQSLPALTAKGLAVMRSLVSPIRRITGAFAGDPVVEGSTDSCPCAVGPRATSSAITIAAGASLFMTLFMTPSCACAPTYR